jgi:hypothetical protein
MRGLFADGANDDALFGLIGVIKDAETAYP